MLTLNKKILLVIISILILLGFAANKSFAIVPKTSEFYVNDSANVLDRDTENYIIDINKKLYDKTGAQIVVVTVKNLEGKSVEEYSTELFREYGIGSKDKNNGVLFIISVEDRKTRIEVGYGLEGRLTDGKTGRILDNYAVPYLTDDKWDEGVRNAFNAILQEVCEEYDVTIDGSEKAKDVDHFESVQYLTAFIVLVICLIMRHVLSGAPLAKWCTAGGLAVVATIIDCIVLHSFSAMSFIWTNLVGALIGTMGILALLSFSGGSSGGSSGGGSSGSGGSSGGGGSSRGF